MKCDFCDNEATVHMFVHVNGQKVEIHLCQNCMEKRMKSLHEAMESPDAGRQMMQWLRKNVPELEKMELPPEAELAEILARTSEETVSALAEEAIDEVETYGREEEEKESAGNSLRSLAQKRKKLLQTRSSLVRMMHEAERREDYEFCASIRDRIARIGDEVAALHEERNKDGK